MLSNSCYESLFQGTSGREWYCGLFQGKYVLFSKENGFSSGLGSRRNDRITGSMHPSVYRGSDGPLHTFLNCDLIKLHTTDQKPTFGKKFKVLALKPQGSSYTKEFFPGTIVSGPKNKNSRKVYKVDFSSEVLEVAEEFIVPPKEFWANPKTEYKVEGDEKKDKKDKKHKKDKKDKKEDKKEKKHKKDKKKSHHKHKHHHSDYSDEDDYSDYDSQPQIIVVPIFIPSQSYGMQQQMLPQQFNRYLY